MRSQHPHRFHSVHCFHSVDSSDSLRDSSRSTSHEKQQEFRTRAARPHPSTKIHCVRPSRSRQVEMCAFDGPCKKYYSRDGAVIYLKLWLLQARTVENNIFLKFSATARSRSTFETSQAPCSPVTIKFATSPILRLLGSSPAFTAAFKQ